MPPHIDRDHARGLRRVQNERHARLVQQVGDFIHGQSKAEYVGDMVQDKQLCPVRERLLCPCKHRRTVPERRIQHNRVDAAKRKRPHDRIVLVSADHHAGIRLHERMDREVERVRGVHGEHHPRRVAHAEQRCGLRAAGIYGFARAHRGRMAAARITRCGVHSAAHGLVHRAGLMQGGGRIVQIDHAPAPSSGSTRQGVIPSCRRRCSA